MALTTKGMINMEAASRKGMTALYMTPAIAKDPAFSGIFFSRLSFLMRTDDFPVRCMKR